MAIGDYPVEYNRKVHGPYDPSRYYGKPDTPLSQVKLGELGAWFSRRNKSPSAIVQACSRAHWRWQFKYMQVKYPSPAAYIQWIVGSMIMGYFINYKKSHITEEDWALAPRIDIGYCDGQDFPAWRIPSPKKIPLSYMNQIAGSRVQPISSPA